MTGSVFDADTGVSPVGEHRFTAELTDRWNIAEVPNGGYSMAVALRAAAQVADHPDPLSVGAHFLARLAAGPVDIEVAPIKRGRSLTTTEVRLSQDGRERLRMLATFGDLDATDGPTEVSDGPPRLDPDQLVASSPNVAIVRLAGQFDYRMLPDQARGAAGEPTGRAETVGQIRFADGRPADLLAMPLVVDAFPPAVFQLGLYGWTPTLELTVHGRARPVPGWLTARIRTRYLQRGLCEEDVEVWDETGTLVALSRQLARAASAASSNEPRARGGDNRRY